jgi:N-acetylmuramoyl-L-alanine amidase
MAIKICLDAGHYGKYNRSPAVKTYYESDMNWKLHLLLKAELESYGIEVITTRADKDTDLGLQARGKKSKGCDLFISIHSNAVGSSVNENVDYPVVYVPISGKADAIGEKLAKCVEKQMGTKQKGYAKKRKGSGEWDYYGVIYGATSVGVPGIIIEHSFHTNTRSTNWLLNDANLATMAKAEAEVIASHYGLKKSDEPKKLYRVQVGAYSVKANAEAQLAKIKKAGFTDAFIAEVTVEK